MSAFTREVMRLSGVAFSGTARRTFRYLAQFYPPAYYQPYLEKLVGFEAILRTLDDAAVPGDVVECGVGRGLTFYVLGHFLARRRSERILFGFDSFKGFPAPTPADASPRRPTAGDMWADTSLRHVSDHFRRGGLTEFFETHVRLVPGFFAETLPSATVPQRIALLNLDVDLYESYRDCLKYLGPRVTGLVVYDEYRSPKWPGATRAVDEAIPALRHRLMFSPVMDRYVSWPEAAPEAFVSRLMDRLGLRVQA
jgi:hypothetical protein